MVTAEEVYLDHRINHLENALGGVEAYVPVRYYKHPTSEIESILDWWPTKISLEEIHKGTVNFSDLIEESSDDYGWHIINIVGYCTCNDDGRTLIDAWGPIDVNVEYVSQPK